MLKIYKRGPDMDQIMMLVGTVLNWMHPDQVLYTGVLQLFSLHLQSVCTSSNTDRELKDGYE
jgi:hypothetical protein